MPFFAWFESLLKDGLTIWDSLPLDENWNVFTTPHADQKSQDLFENFQALADCSEDAPIDGGTTID